MVQPLAACYSQNFKTPTQTKQITISGGRTQALVVFKICHVEVGETAQWLSTHCSCRGSWLMPLLTSTGSCTYMVYVYTPSGTYTYNKK